MFLLLKKWNDIFLSWSLIFLLSIGGIFFRCNPRMESINVNFTIILCILHTFDFYLLVLTNPKTLLPSNSVLLWSIAMYGFQLFIITESWQPLTNTISFVFSKYSNSKSVKHIRYCFELFDCSPSLFIFLNLQLFSKILCCGMF